MEGEKKRGTDRDEMRRGGGGGGYDLFCKVLWAVGKVREIEEGDF